METKTLTRCPVCHHGMWREVGCTNCRKPVAEKIAVTPEPPKQIPKPTPVHHRPKSTYAEDFAKAIALIPKDEPKRNELADLIVKGGSAHLAKATLGSGYYKKASELIKALNRD